VLLLSYGFGRWLFATRFCLSVACLSVTHVLWLNGTSYWKAVLTRASSRTVWKVQGRSVSLSVCNACIVAKWYVILESCLNQGLKWDCMERARGECTAEEGKQEGKGKLFYWHLFFPCINKQMGCWAVNL